MPATFSDLDLAEINRLLHRFRLDAAPEVKALSEFINTKIVQEQPTADATPPAPLEPAHHNGAQPQAMNS